MEGPAIGIIVLTSIELVLSITVLYLLFSIKYKDFTIYLKTELLVYDILQEISVLIVCFIGPYQLSDTISYNQALNQTQFIYARFIHLLQILYMSRALYKAIVHKSIVSNKEILKFTIFSNFVALGLAFTYLILLILFPSSYLTIASASFLVILDIPSILIVFPLIWFYYHIRKTLKQEFLLTIQVAQQKRAIAKQLIFYPMIYFIYVCFYLMAFLTIFIAIDSSTDIVVLNTLFCIYPLMNSVVYGISNSTKRFMYAICLRDKEYEEMEEVENELRNENLLAPRVYCDLFTDK
jgi:hypothetical protein